MQTENTNKSFGQVISFVAAVSVLLCFFVPWVEVGFSVVKTNLSGYQLATGSGPAGVSLPGWTLLLLVPASMIGVLTLVVWPRLGFGSTHKHGPTIGALLALAGAASAVAMMYQYYDLNAEFNKNVLGVLAQNLVTHSFGWTASLIGSVIVVVGGVIDLYSSNKAKRVSAATGAFWNS